MNLQRALQLGGSITFACGGPATIRLKRTYTIQRNTSIDGGGTVTLDGGHNIFGMFLGSSDAISFTLSRLSVVNAGRFVRPGETAGRAHGEFIGGRFRLVELLTVSVERSVWPVWLDSGSLHVRGSSFSNNDGSVLGGATMEVLDHSVFRNNRYSTIWSEGGDVAIEDSDFLSNSGPVIASKGKLKINHANFTGNVSDGNGGALRIGSDATIEESDFYNNAAANGGALFIGGNTRTVSLRALKFYNNVATQTGGAISFEKSQLPLDLTMQHMTFQENRANSGGAITLARTRNNNLFVNGGAVAFVRNEAADSGGAIFAPNAGMQLSRGVFIGNRAGKVGGAIAALEQPYGKVVLANSLLVRNAAPRGSAFWGNRATFVNSTIADNSGTAVWPQDIPLGPTLGTTPFFIQFVNSIVAGTFTGACRPTASSIPYVGHNNLQYPGASCGAHLAPANPYLGAYYVPFFWSPALGAGDNAVCDATPINHKDVYNVRRPLGRSGCAIGAVEGDIQHLIHRWLTPEYSQGLNR
jgi:predicted outer membrane repeat protein